MKVEKKIMEIPSLLDVLLNILMAPVGLVKIYLSSHFALKNLSGRHLRNEKQIV